MEENEPSNRKEEPEFKALKISRIDAIKITEAIRVISYAYRKGKDNVRALHEYVASTCHDLEVQQSMTFFLQQGRYADDQSLKNFSIDFERFVVAQSRVVNRGTGNEKKGQG